MRNPNVQGREEHEAEQQARRRSVVPWSPGQVLPVLVGLFFAVFGMVGLIRTGFHPQDWTGPEKDLLGFDVTSLLALIELVFGLVVVVSASVLPWGGRPWAALLGVLAVGFGILLAAFSSSWERFFGGDASNGWLFAAGGAVMLMAAAFRPVRSRDIDAVGPDLGRAA
jgi:peptidoglycan/LPS O-acetylase OafA/YrhL